MSIFVKFRTMWKKQGIAIINYKKKQWSTGSAVNGNSEYFEKNVELRWKNVRKKLQICKSAICRQIGMKGMGESGWKKTGRTESTQEENPHTEHTQRQQHFCLLLWQ